MPESVYSGKRWVSHGKNAYDATLIANRLRQKGGTLAGSPQGFLVAGMEGPLLDGELDRAAQWARTIIDA